MLIQILLFYIGLAALWWLYTWLYQDYRVDLLRYRLFVIRDRLFNFALTGKISFDHPAYRMMRLYINGSLRFAHRMSLLIMLVNYWLQKKYATENSSRFHAQMQLAAQDLNFEQKKYMIELFVDVHLAIFAHVAMISILIFPFALLAKMAFKLKLVNIKKIHHKNKERFEPIDAMLYELGGMAR